MATSTTTTTTTTTGPHIMLTPVVNLDDFLIFAEKFIKNFKVRENENVLLQQALEAYLKIKELQITEERQDKELELMEERQDKELELAEEKQDEELALAKDKTAAEIDLIKHQIKLLHIQIRKELIQADAIAKGVDDNLSINVLNAYVQVASIISACDEINQTALASQVTTLTAMMSKILPSVITTTNSDGSTTTKVGEFAADFRKKYAGLLDIELNEATADAYKH